MIKKLTGLMAFIICFNASAQVTQRNLLSGHFTIQDVEQSVVSYENFRPFPTTPDEWKKHLPDSTIHKLIKDGESNLKFKFTSIPVSVILAFKREGNRTKYEAISFAKRAALMQLLMAESVEGRGRFIDAIIDGVWSICEESYWGIPAHITKTEGVPNVENPYVELFTAETATTLALVNYFVGSQIENVNPLFINRLNFEIENRFFKPLTQNLNTYEYLSKDSKVNNWNPWIMANWISTILLVEKDKTKRASMLYSAMQGVDIYFNGLGDDGGCDEGPHYWNAAGGAAFDCLEWLQKGTYNKVNIFKEPLIQKMTSYMYKAYIGQNYFVNIGDGSPEIKDLNAAFFYRIGTILGDEQMKQFGLLANKISNQDFKVGTLKIRAIENLIDNANLPKNQVDYKQLEYAWVSDIQLMTARTKNNLFLATHGGHNGESHNHNDVGDFVIYVNNKPFIVDAGSSTYTAKTFSPKRYELWNMQSQYHNLPIINGIGQHEGREYTANKVVATNTNNEAKLLMDITNAYPKKTGIEFWRRTNSLLRLKEEIVIRDEFELKNPSSQIQQTFLTPASVDLSKKGHVILKVEKDILELIYDDTLFSVSTDMPIIIGPDFAKIGKSWNGSLTRILLTLKKTVKKGVFVYRFKKGIK